jgi:Transglutaminase-like superfamily
VTAGAVLRRLGRLDRGTVRAAVWADRTLRGIRATLPVHGLRAEVGPPPAAPFAALRGVLAVARRRDATCLERSLLVQAWLDAHGRPHAVLVGVAAGEDFAAHAWVDGFDALDASRFIVIARRPAA